MDIEFTEDQTLYMLAYIQRSSIGTNFGNPIIYSIVNDIKDVYNWLNIEYDRGSLHIAFKIDIELLNQIILKEPGIKDHLQLVHYNTWMNDKAGDKNDDTKSGKI